LKKVLDKLEKYVYNIIENVPRFKYLIQATQAPPKPNKYLSIILYNPHNLLYNTIGLFVL